MKKLIEEDNVEWRTFHTLAMIYFERSAINPCEEIDFVIEALTEALDKFPDHTRLLESLMIAWSHKAEASARERDWEGVVHAHGQSVRILEEQITRLPRGGYHPYLHGCAAADCQNLLRVLSQLGRSDEARDAWKRMCFHWREKESLEPDDAGVNHTLARALVTGPFWDPSSASEALKYAETALSLDPKDATFWITLGVIRYRLDDLDGALGAFDDAYELRLGGDALEWYFRAMIHHRQGDSKQAKYWLRRANRWTQQNDPDNQELEDLRAESEELLARGPISPTGSKGVSQESDRSGAPLSSDAPKETEPNPGPPGQSESRRAAGSGGSSG
ncbi:MAG: tetratricopeptide repeat protein [Planctomycetes bacterium]|nr:tetratricopeptide repeat protein [Planctomycetota bacterium]